MRISDWSSDVCSSDLVGGEAGAQQVDRDTGHYGGVEESEDCNHSAQQRGEPEKAADGAEIHAVDPGGAAMPERQVDGDGGAADGRCGTKVQGAAAPQHQIGYTAGKARG